MTAEVRTTNRLIGSPVPRVEDLRFLRGRGEYVGDLAPDGMLHAAILRSGVAHGRIRAIDTAAARARPGVRAVITAAEIGTVPLIPQRLDVMPEFKRYRQPVIADQKVRYVGEPLALVVADSAALAEDALEAIDVDIEALPVVADRDAARADTVRLFDGDSNVTTTLTALKGDAAAALKTAPYVRRERFKVHRFTAVPMEPRGLLAQWDAAAGLLTVYGAAKIAFPNRRILAGLIGLPESAIRMVENDVGGGFGARGEFYPEDFLIPFAARLLDRPVRWIEDRRENLMACNHARDGELTHEPVFVHTARPEFNFPSGEKYEQSVYQGKGGFPISSFLMRVAAAVREGEPNILLTDYLTPNSRMMIHRKVRERLQELAGFLSWDEDPYLVIADDGRLVWMVDGYTTSAAHPYSRDLDLGDMGRVNYIRNAVKATVDAYDGETRFYIFAPDDPIIAAYQRLFPDLFHPSSDMPADLRRHARYPELLFRVQAEIYRTYHMLDPQSFYNKEDVWDLARHGTNQNQAADAVTPTYVMAALPGQEKPEFLLLLPFTPRNKDNLIGLMAARCDGDNLGEIVVLQLSKQQLIFGPMQIAARINQDQNISKDLTLWNQQGSQVLRGQTLVLPVGNTFLYVDPIYIQATEARMPQLKKIVLAVGNRLIYADTYDQALAQLSTGAQSLVQQAASAAPSTPPASGTVAAPPPGADQRLQRVRDHLRRYRDLAAQGHWSEAGKELEAIEAEVK